MIPAGHDRIGTTWEQGYGDFVKLTGSGTVNPVKCIKGFHFVSIAQKEKPDILKQNLEKTAIKTKFTFARVISSDNKKGFIKRRLSAYIENILYILTGRLLFHGYTYFALFRSFKDHQ